MACGGGTGKLGLARLDRHHPLARRPGPLGQRGKGRGIVDPLDIHAQRRDTRIVDQRAGQIGQTDDGGIAKTGDIGHRQTALLHAKVDHDVRGLADQRHALVDPHPAMLIGPQKRAVEVVDHPIAVRPQDRHLTRRRDEFRLQLRRARLGPAGGKADRPARAHGGQFGHHLDRGKAVDADKGRIRHARQIGERWIGLQSPDLALGRMHRPDRPVKPHLAALLDDVQRPAGAKYGDGLGTKETVKAFHGRPPVMW